MAAVVVEIAEAVVDALNAASLSQSFEAERAYVPTIEETDPTLRVLVVPRNLSLVALHRHADDFDYVIDVAVLKRTDRTPEAVDPYMLLVQEIVDLFRGVTLTFGAYDADEASCVASANAPIYAPDFLDDRRVFVSVVSLTFRVARDRP